MLLALNFLCESVKEKETKPKYYHLAKIKSPDGTDSDQPVETNKNLKPPHIKPIKLSDKLKAILYKSFLLRKVPFSH